MRGGRWRNGQTPPIVYDGRFWWYTEWWDPTDDRCCRCQARIGDEETALELWRHVGPRTWSARFCHGCTPVVVRMLSAPTH